MSNLSAFRLPPSPQIEGGGGDSYDADYVEAGTKTTIDVTASAYDDRPGESGGDVGCGEDGCLPGLAHDGIGEEDLESRWSCAKDIVPDGGQCEIKFAFGSPQNIVDVQVAFWKGDERTRTLKVRRPQMLVVYLLVVFLLNRQNLHCSWLSLFSWRLFWWLGVMPLVDS